ncbi:serine protease [Streptomyces sp. TRM 70351]|uniref:S1 family peptidase n=1 Tax=Streptomyces sp. TRM 70351 TaxID=3116552 RepID=UPI002E7B5CB0|nr:serine protease [Streptomyces sp. TRM 70351]MEE1927815.1 serine protease [Streptomyces sp. TRM 70351]
MRRSARKRPGTFRSGAAALLLSAVLPLGLVPAPAAAARPLPVALPAPDAAPGPAVPADQRGLTGTVALSNCSGSLVRLPRSRPGDPALVLTNGHCLEGGALEPGEVVTARPANRAFTLLDRDGTELATLRSVRLVYATITGTDVAVYRLTASYTAIAARHGVTALTLDHRRPAAGTRVTVPSGYWKRVYRCAIDGFVPTLREGRWTMTDSLRFTPECATVAGTSGAPVLDRATGHVVGINSTGNDDGGHCTVHNPCEVGTDGTVTVRRGTNYGQQTYGLTRCFRPGSLLDLRAPGCALPGA